MKMVIGKEANHMNGQEELFVAILTGTATPEEKDQFRELMKQEGDRRRFEQVKKIWDEAPYVQRYRNTDPKRAFPLLVRKIGMKKRNRQRDFMISLISAAAGIFLMAGLFTLYLYLFDRTVPETAGLIQTELGNRSFVLLPDSTKVWLNSKSRIHYHTDFGKGSRQVFLTGEGYFDVTHHRTPFIVNVEALEIVVHGTRFNVSAYPDDNQIYTCLEAGQISIKKDAKANLLVEPGQLVVYDKQTSKFDITPVNAPEYSSWRQNEMYLHAESLRYLVKKLERKYNIEIVFTPEELGNRIHYSGIFTDESIEEILDAIAIASDLTYTKKGNRYEIKIK